MTRPRYAIVRVDYQDCPIKYMVPKKHRKIKCMPFKCDKCRLHGDTKEQLIAKVRQVLEREIQQKHIEVEFDNGFILSLTTKGLAKEIVEFLGVEK